jgi:hypothetical protein
MPPQQQYHPQQQYYQQPPLQELDSLLARFPALPDGAIKTMVEQRIGELFAASAAPPAPTPAAPGLSDTENVQDAVGEAKGGAE